MYGKDASSAHLGASELDFESDPPKKWCISELRRSWADHRGIKALENICMDHFEPSERSQKCYGSSCRPSVFFFVNFSKIPMKTDPHLVTWSDMVRILSSELTFQTAKTFNIERRAVWRRLRTLSCPFDFMYFIVWIELREFAFDENQCSKIRKYLRFASIVLIQTVILVIDRTNLPSNMSEVTWGR